MEMKKMALRYSVMLAVVWGAQIPAVAQEYEYVPLVREGVKWEYFYIDENKSVGQEPGLGLFTLEFRGDTLIGGTTYKKMYINYDGKEYLADFMREENKRVYFVKNQDCEFEDMLARSPKPTYSEWSGDNEALVFDFNDMANIFTTSWPGLTITEELVTIGGKLRKKFLWGQTGIYTIEGIGHDSSWYGRLPYHMLNNTYCACNFTSNLHRTIDANGNTEYSRNPGLSAVTGIEAPAGHMKVAVNDGVVSVTPPQHMEVAVVEVIDMTGRVVCSKPAYGGEPLAISGLSAGIYMVQCGSGPERQSKKISL